jgi:type IV secretion system protein VirD4
VSDSEHLPYIVAAAALAAILVSVWLIGGLADLLFGGGWSAVPASEVAMTALRLPSHLDDPRQAWPPAARAALPGPAGFYTSAALFAGIVCLATYLLHRTPIPSYLHRMGGDRRRPPTARWATLKDLALLRVPAPQPGRLTLGRIGRNLIAAEERASVIVFAPTGTHKTTGLAIPALLEWQGPVLVTSVKNDLLEATIDAREKVGEVMVFDPVGVSGMDATTQVSPLWGAGTLHGAMQVAHWLCGAAQSGKGGLKDADFWFATAEKLLAPLLFAAASCGETMADVVHWLDEGPKASEGKVAELLGEAGNHDAELAWQATQNREERQRSSVYTTAETIVSAYADERVKSQTRDAEYTPEQFLNGERNTFYLCAPLQEQERLRPLFSMVVQEFLSHAYRQAALQGRPLDPPPLVLLDEAANIAPFPELDAIASTAAGQGIQLMTIFQDISQVRTTYGPKAATIVNNHRAKIIGPGISDRETLAYVSAAAGAGEFDQSSHSVGEGRNRTQTRSKAYHDLVPANVMRELQPGTALLMYHNLPLAQIALRPRFVTSSLRLRAG